MTDNAPTQSRPLPGTTPSEMFPLLTPVQQSRVLAHGKLRKAGAGETIAEFNQQTTKFFVVVSGQLSLIQPSNDREEVVAICRPGMFTGELNVLSGRRGLLRISATESCELIEIEREPRPQPPHGPK